MTRGKQAAVLVGGLAALSLVAGLAYRLRPPGLPSTPSPQPGLAWLPAEAEVVGGVELVELRRQNWLLEILAASTAHVREEPDYRNFVAGTGFDYARDLDRVWFALWGANEHALVAGVAEGRFARQKILDYARQQGAGVEPHQGIDIYEWRALPAAPGQPARSFALAFLDDTHLAFGSDRPRAASAVDCWLGRAASVGSDAKRSEEVTRWSAGRQAWLVANTERWSPSLPATAGGPSSLAKVVTQFALGLSAGAEGLNVAATARCRDAAQAQRLRDNLQVMALAGQLALARDKNPTGRALAQDLKHLTFSLQGDRVEARIQLAPETVGGLLGGVRDSLGQR
ncbi:MAG: hypothetical protein ACRD35_02975 [Candidatus Acidiferrales bacterium]